MSLRSTTFWARWQRTINEFTFPPLLSKTIQLNFTSRAFQIRNTTHIEHNRLGTLPMSAGDLYTSSRADDHHSSHLHDTNAKSTTSTSSHTALDKQQPYIPPSAPSPPRTRRPSSPVPPHQRNPPGHHFSQPVAAFPPGGAAMASSELEPSSQWLFTAAEMADTPSVRDGLTVAEESCRRAKGVNFIIQTGILLKIPQLTLGTAAVFFHRFYMRYSMVVEKGGIHHYVSLACLAQPGCHDRRSKRLIK